MKNMEIKTGQKNSELKNALKLVASVFMLLMLTLFSGNQAFAHCDSYDGPVIKDAEIALETNNVNLVLKWINKEQEEEITSLFKKTIMLKSGDKEVYAIVKKHFLETLVRLHRETEGAPYTGLKPAGTTKMIIQLSDKAISTGSADDLVSKLNNHIENILRQKYEKVSGLYKVKDESVELGREYVEAYVDYTHTIEAIHDILEHGGGHAGH